MTKEEAPPPPPPALDYTQEGMKRIHYFISDGPVLIRLLYWPSLFLPAPPLIESRVANKIIVCATGFVFVAQRIQPEEHDRFVCLMLARVEGIG